MAVDEAAEELADDAAAELEEEAGVSLAAGSFAAPMRGFNS